MAAPKGRVRVGGYVTPKAADGWDDFCRRHGVNMSALCEAIGVALVENPSTDDMPLRTHVDEAKRIEQDRLRRGRRRQSD